MFLESVQLQSLFKAVQSYAVGILLLNLRLVLELLAQVYFQGRSLLDIGLIQIFSNINNPILNLYFKGSFCYLQWILNIRKKTVCSLNAEVIFYCVTFGGPSLMIVLSYNTKMCYLGTLLYHFIEENS